MPSTPTRTAPQQAEAESPFVDVQSWNEDTLRAFNRLSISASPPVVRGTSVALSIPLDSENRPTPVKNATVEDDGDEADGIQLPSASGPSVGRTIRRVPSRRDSMKRRDALLKGNEGTRRRQKWENGEENYSLKHWFD